MLRNLNQTPVFASVARRVDLTGSGGSQQSPSQPRIPAILRTVWDASREALAAYRGYARLTRRGIRPDPALRQALGLACTTADAPSTSGTWHQPAHTPASTRIGNLAYVA